MPVEIIGIIRKRIISKEIEIKIAGKVGRREVDL